MIKYNENTTGRRLVKLAHQACPEDPALALRYLIRLRSRQLKHDEIRYVFRHMYFKRK